MDRFVPRDDKVALSFARDDDAFVIASEARQSLREISCTDRFVPLHDEVVHCFVSRDDDVAIRFVLRDHAQLVMASEARPSLRKPHNPPH
jgi:phosphorylcholine metabolism protein LicD